MLIEQLPNVKALPAEQKRILIDELWLELAHECESEAPNTDIAALLEKRFAAFIADESTASPVDAAFAKLAERKRQWK
jgi:putative addiction module component (TIGR02574 family)